MQLIFGPKSYANTLKPRRKRQSRNKIEHYFVQQIQKRRIDQITVTEICTATNLNRSTFYANYTDIYDLADKIRIRLENEIAILFHDEIEHKYNSNNFLKIFRNIYENQLFYKAYFKLNLDRRPVSFYRYDTQLAEELYHGKHIEYHMEFFKAGFNAIVHRWLDNGCRETPEEINQILIEEYQKNNFPKVV